MSDVPKFVLKRLPENAALETHPDADLLTGFVEKSLLEPERNRVTEHLARCSACRAVVALAMPESPELPEVPELEVPALTTSSNARRRDWFNSAVLRWVVVTAGIVAITSVGILQYRSHQNKIADDNILLSRNAAPPPVPSADQAPLVPSQPLSVPPEAKKRQPTDSREKVQPSRPEHMATGGSTGSSNKMLRTPPGSYTASAPDAAVVSGYAGGRVSAAPPPPAPNPSVGQQPAASSSSQTVEVESQSATIATSIENEVADQLAKDEKKQTSKNQSSADSAVITPPSRWSISADGALQRSWDDGHT